MSMQKVPATTSKEKNLEEKENKPPAVSQKFRESQTSSEKISHLLTAAIAVTDTSTQTANVITDLPSFLPNSCKAVPMPDLGYPTYSINRFYKHNSVPKSQIIPAEIKLQSIELNQYQKEACEYLKDKGLTPKHFLNQSWFNSPDHIKALIHMMTYSTTKGPDRAIDFLRKETPDFIKWCAIQYDEQEKTSTLSLR